MPERPIKVRMPEQRHHRSDLVPMVLIGVVFLGIVGYFSYVQPRLKTTRSGETECEQELRLIQEAFRGMRIEGRVRYVRGQSVAINPTTFPGVAPGRELLLYIEGFGFAIPSVDPSLPEPLQVPLDRRDNTVGVVMIPISIRSTRP